MERKFYEDEFEHFLKKNADQFKMYPSKKVWHGIYNDTHPGKRWPSIAMSLIFIFTLVLVDHLNTQQSQYHHTYSSIPEKYSSSTIAKNVIQKDSKTFASNKQSIKAHEKNTVQNNASTVSKADRIKTQAARIDDRTNSIEKLTTSNNEIPTAQSANTSSKNTLVTLAPGNNINKDPELQKPAGTNDLAQVGNVVTTSIFDQANEITGVTTIPRITPSNIKDESAEKSRTGIDNIPITGEPKNVAVNVHHIKIHKNPKISWAYYFSPTVSYRTYSRRGNDADQLYLIYPNTLIGGNVNRGVTQRPSAGLEGGTAFRYDLNKKLKFISGLQLNYSAYSVQANNIHPIIAALVLHNENTGTPYAISTISYFSNGPGSVPENLHNYSFQLSLPVGFEYQLAGNNRIQWNAAATLQPSVVLSSKAYILSTDKRNYITEASLSRPFNLNTNIGTSVSFNSNKFKWEIGPQIHYQLLSSYKSPYQVREHFIDYGIRLGVSKIIK